MDLQVFEIAVKSQLLLSLIMVRRRLIVRHKSRSLLFHCSLPNAHFLHLLFGQRRHQLCKHLVLHRIQLHHPLLKLFYFLNLTGFLVLDFSDFSRLWVAFRFLSDRLVNDPNIITCWQLPDTFLSCHVEVVVLLVLGIEILLENFLVHLLNHICLQSYLF